MNNMKKCFIIFLIVFIITVILFLPWIKGHYTTDTYEIMQMGYVEYASNVFLTNGRLLSAIFLIIANIINIPIQWLVGISLVAALIISSLSVVSLYNIAMKYKGSDNNILLEILLIMISYCIIFNFFYIEDLFFLETVIMALSVYLSICAAKVFIAEDKYYTVKTVIILSLLTICYNGSITIFPLLAICFYLIKENTIDQKLFLKKVIQIAIICAIVLLLDLLLIKFIPCITNQKVTDRINLNLSRNIVYISRNAGSVIVNTSNIFPKYFFIGFTIAVIINMVVTAKEEKSKHLINELILMCIGIVSPFCIYISTLSSFGSGRLHVAMGMLIGVLMLYNIIKIKEQKKSMFFVGIVIIYFLVNVVNYAMIIKEHKEVNKINENNVIEIKQYVEEYEKANNKDVKYIAMKLVPGKVRKSIL